MIWGDAPHWMVVDDEVLALVRAANGTKDLRRVIEEVSDRTGASREEVATSARGVLQQMERAGVAYRKRPKERPLSRRPMLENVTVNVTRRCNLRCAHCFIDGHGQVEDRLEVSDLERFLRDGRRYLQRNLNFAILGGEPLMAKEKTLAIAELARRWGGECIVSTNGLLIDGEFAAAAKERDLIVQVSLEGSRPDVNDPIRGRGSFDKAVKGVEVLVERGTRSIMSMVVQSSNVHDIEGFYELSEALGTDEVRFIPMNVMGRAREGDLRPIRNVELVRALHELIRTHPSAKERMGRDYFTILKTMCALSNRRLYCGTGFKTILVDADGETYPCPNHQFPEFRCGNIAERSFKEIWLQSPVLKRVRSTYDLESNNEDCPTCPVKHWCMGGCRGETYENTGDMRGRSVRCEELREAIFEMLWVLGSEGELVENADRTEYF